MSAPSGWRFAPGVVALAALLLLGPGQAARAAGNAQFTAVLGGVTYQAGGQGSWRGARTGTQLGSGVRVRTDRRGKCEIRFPGGSLVRMPPRADLLLTSVTDNRVRLLSGQVLTNAVKGSGVRIEGASTTASVQGTWVLFGDGEMSVWDGTATFETPTGTQEVGDQQRAALAGVAVPLVGDDGQEYGQVRARLTGDQLTIGFRVASPWLLRRTSVAVSTAVPQRFDTTAPPHDHPDLHATTDEHTVTVEGLQPGAPTSLYLVAYAELTDEAGRSDEAVGWGEGEPLETGGMYLQYADAATAPERPWEFPTGTSRSWWYTIQPGLNTVATPGTGLGIDMRDQRFTSYEALRDSVFGVPTHGRLEVGVRHLAAAASAGGGTAAAWPLALALGGAASDGEPAGVARLGKRFFGPTSQVDLYGLLVEGGGVAGGRARLAAVYGPVYMELGGELSTQFEDEADVALSEAFAIWRSGDLDLTVGRQHYLEGPVNNSPLGSQFAYLTFDGVRARYQGRGFTLDGIWLDGYERNLVRPGDGGGWLGRVGVPALGGQFGLNVLSERGADTGLSLDFSLPAVPKVLDVYGEFGRDPWDHQFETWGLYSPWLFEKTGLDLFAEYAHREGLPHSLSAMAYKDLSNDWYGLAAVRQIEGGDCEFSVGAAWRYGSLGK